MLKSYQLPAKAAGSGEEALRELVPAQHNHPYDLVLLDWKMPGIDGIETARRIDRNNRLSGGIPKIIMITAFGTEEVRRQADEAGFDALIPKPVQASYLLDTIMNVFGGQGPRVSRGVQEKVREALKSRRFDGARILVVEDNPVNQQVAQEILEYAGAEVRLAQNGREALAAVNDSEFDAVLMDVQMPGMDGYEVCRRLKSDEKTRDIPVVFVTSLSDLEDETTGLELGAVDYITKPVRPPIVRVRVKNHLELKRKSDILESLASMDGLTCLTNRRRFIETLDMEWRRATRSGTPLSLAMIDVDFFKAYNDHFGHIAGDECLRMIACALDNSIRRAGDLVARYGGEEFVALLPKTDLEGAVQVAETMRNEINALDIQHASPNVADRVTISVGVATMIPTVDDSCETLLNAADKALYEAKENGRNQVTSATRG
jgi:diguanylate cyclase (GGDEF)-like protein